MQESLRWTRLLTLQLGSLTISLVALASAIVVFLIGWLAAGAIGKGLERVIKRGATRVGAGRTASRWTTYGLRLVAFLVALQIGGINVTGIFAAGAVLAVGIGLAMQKIAENFVSGLILLLERSIQVGDILELEDELVCVEHMGLRATIVRTLDEERVIVPNGLLVQNAVKNLSLEDSSFRVRIEVGVPHEANLGVVRSALEEAGRGVPDRDKDKDPVVFFVRTAPSSLDFELSVWTDDPWNQKRTASEMRERVFAALRSREIELAFPQLDVHLDPTRGERASKAPIAVA